MKALLNATVQQLQRVDRSVRAVPAAVAAAVAATGEEVRRQNKKAGAGVEVAVLAVRHRLGMDGGDARVIGIFNHTPMLGV